MGLSCASLLPEQAVVLAEIGDWLNDLRDLCALVHNRGLDALGHWQLLVVHQRGDRGFHRRLLRRRRQMQNAQVLNIRRAAGCCARERVVGSAKGQGRAEILAVAIALEGAGASGPATR